MSKKLKEEGKPLTYSEAAQIKYELLQLDLSYVKKEFSVREIRLIVQENVIGLADGLRPIEPQQKEINESVAEFNNDFGDLNRKYSIGVKDVTLTKEERFEYESALEELKLKYKDVLDSYKEKNADLLKLMDTKECVFQLKKLIKKDMLPANITGSDMQILSRLIEW